MVIRIAKGGRKPLEGGTDSVGMYSGNLPDVPRIALRPGYSISKIIKGGWQLAGDHGAVDAEQAVTDMICFSDAGITTFDCADIYTGVEVLIGRFRVELSRIRGEEAVGAIKIHTKYVPDREGLAFLTMSDVEAGIDMSLKRLDLDRLDLVQLHWWDYGTAGCAEAAGHLSRLREKGKIDLIGVTNFDVEHLDELCAVTDIASAQVQYSLLDRRASGEFARYARENDISIFAYGVLAGGFLTDAWLGRPDPGFEFHNRSLVKYRLVIEEFGGWPLFQNLLAALRRVADRHFSDIATIALRATLDCLDVAATIIGARYIDRLQPMLRALAIELSDQDRNVIENVRRRSIGPHGPVYGLERDITGRHGRIMKYNLNKADSRPASHSAKQGDTV